MADIEAGRRTDAFSSTVVVAVQPDRTTDFNGTYVFQASAENINVDLNGLHGIGNRAGTGVVGWGGINDRSNAVLGATGVVGVGGDTFSAVGGQAVVGFGGRSSDNVGGTGVVGIGGEGGRGREGVHGVMEGGAGVIGSSQRSDGVVGLSNAGGKSGVFGFNFSTGGNAFGVFGATSSSLGIGVAGRNDNGIAVSGFSANKVGVEGVGKHTGVHGRSNDMGVLGEGGTGVTAVGQKFGLVASATNEGGRAAFLWGDVLIAGALTVVAGVKSVAVPMQDGALGRLYCLETPENWFEDFGEGALREGRAVVTIAPDFAAVVHGHGYHVFLTPLADCAGLFIADRGDKAFVVRELNGGDSSVAFSYRIVVKRKDVDAKRFERVELPERPTIPEHEPPPISAGHERALASAKLVAAVESTRTNKRP